MNTTKDATALQDFHFMLALVLLYETVVLLTLLHILTVAHDLTNLDLQTCNALITYDA